MHTISAGNLFFFRSSSQHPARQPFQPARRPPAALAALAAAAACAYRDARWWRPRARRRRRWWRRIHDRAFGGRSADPHDGHPGGRILRHVDGIGDSCRSGERIDLDSRSNTGALERTGDAERAGSTSREMIEALGFTGFYKTPRGRRNFRPLFFWQGGRMVYSVAP